MRADKFFAGKFGSRTKSAEAIEKGWVLVNGKTIRPKDEVSDLDEVVFVQPSSQFVSNGGYKLERAIQSFGVCCAEKVFVDIGASTGGFTDCLLQHGAKRIYAVDVGDSLLHESLRTRTEVVIMDNTNARYLTKDAFLERIHGVVTDVSFISLRLILPVISAILDENGDAFVLVKPQFECENKHIGKSGIVHPSAHAGIVKKVLQYAQNCGLYAKNIVNAPIRKGKNIEYILWLTPCGKESQSDTQILEIVKNLLNSTNEKL